MTGSNAGARVVIVGAGPVGMVCALALNRRGVAVTVFEQEPAPVEDQRAASLHPSTLEMLDDLGVSEKIIPLGLISSAYRFHDRVSHSVVAEFDLGLMRDEFRFPYVLQYEQYKLTASIAAEIGVQHLTSITKNSNAFLPTQDRTAWGFRAGNRDCLRRMNGT
jgi:3-(3-hydroxy-phenyl)propionate hydroxylase